jgi:hypothetical protein
MIPNPLRSDKGHFQTKSKVASWPVYWSGPPTRADVLHLAFVLNNALGSPACPVGYFRLRTSETGISPTRKMPDTITKPTIGE